MKEMAEKKTTSFQSKQIKIYDEKKSEKKLISRQRIEKQNFTKKMD